jgi:hypothetical protein
MAQNNWKYNEDGNKRASWYGILWEYAVSGKEDPAMKKYGLDDEDKATIEQYKKHIASCEKNGIVPQFGWSWEG